MSNCCAIPTLSGRASDTVSAMADQRDELCLVVMVSKKMPRTELDADTILPRELDGVPIDVIETGAFVV